MTESVLLQSDSHGVATLTLNRPEKHNAFDDALIAELTIKLKQLDADPAVRVVVLTASGKTFSAGGDLNWMRSMAAFSEAENLADALKLAELLDTLASLHKPTIAKVNGPAYGGGVGLIACCDIAIASETAYDMGLVHEVVTADILDETVGTVATNLLKGGPKAILACKELIAGHDSAADRQAVKQKTAQLIAKLRVSPEGQEGLSAFLEKRPPNWNK